MDSGLQVGEVRGNQKIMMQEATRWADRPVEWSPPTGVHYRRKEQVGTTVSSKQTQTEKYMTRTANGVLLKVP